MFTEVLLIKSGGQIRTLDPEVRLVDNAQTYLSRRASFFETLSGIKELLLCALEGLYGAEIFIVKGKTHVYLE